VQGLTENVVKDWVEVVTKSPEHAKKIVIGVRFRNTLFHTVQFYDLVLNGFGAQALDWVGVSMADPLYRYQLIQWYQRYFGIEVCKWDGQEWVLEELVPDTGPIAWKQVAFELSVPEDPIVKIRFRFLPDNIQLDWIGVSYDISSDYKTQDVLCDQISPINNCQADIAPSMLFQRDDQYLITYPADSYFLSFHVGIPSNALSRTCFIKSYGYYIEWIRKDWLISASCGSDKPLFAFDESSIVMAAKAWTNKKTDFERIFFESKLMLRGDRLP